MDSMNPYRQDLEARVRAAEARAAAAERRAVETEARAGRYSRRNGAVVGVAMAFTLFTSLLGSTCTLQEALEVANLAREASVAACPSSTCDCSLDRPRQDSVLAPSDFHCSPLGDGTYQCKLLENVRVDDGKIDCVCDVGGGCECHVRPKHTVKE